MHKVRGESSLLPSPDYPGPGRNLKTVCGRRATAPSSCLVNVHAKTALTEPCTDQELAAIGNRDTSDLEA